jgi:hypothetical protein
MAKAVLIMDMPNCCADCQLADDDPSGLYCVPADKYYDGEESTEDRASWCPLRELPEKKERRIGEHGERMFRAGFNACLNEIMRQGMSDSVD